nr:hypothetical protein [uncultured Psychrobacter sp.]
MNIIFMPSGSNVWTDVIKEFEVLGLYPKLWFGDPKHNNFAKKNYPECEVFDFNLIHKNIYLKSEDVGVDLKLIQNKDFFVLKDQVYKMMDRQDDLGVYSRIDREAIFYSAFYFFYTKIVNSKIKLAVSAEGPHSPITMTIYGICKILGIPCYHLAQNSILPLAHIAKDFFNGKVRTSNILKKFNSKVFLNITEDYIDAIDNVIPTPLYMKIQNKNNRLDLMKDTKKFFLRPIVRNIVFVKEENNYSINRINFYNSNKPHFFKDLKIHYKKDSLRKEYINIAKSLNLEEEFVFVPLHYEPERTSNPDGGDFYNAYDMIVFLRSFVPKHVKLILKEHPSQFTKTLNGHRGRSVLFYKSIQTLPNVEFVNIDFPSTDLINKSIFIATQTGSAALEASILGNKSLIFGNPWFTGVPNIYTYDSISYDSLIEKKIDPKEKIKEYIFEYMIDHTMPVCVNPSNLKYFKEKYPEHISVLLNDKLFAKEFTRSIYNDFFPK